MRIRAAAPAALVLLAVAGLTPPAVGPAPDPWEEACRRGYTIENGQRISLLCTTAIRYETRTRFPDYARYPEADEVPVLPYLPSVYAAQPSDLRVGAEPACGAGPVGTTEPVTLSAAFTVVLGPPPSRALFEQDPDGRGVYGEILEPIGRAVLTIQRGELAPGDSIRWRVRFTDEDDRLGTWSPWCTFTVAADAPDLRNLDSGVIDALLELGLRPERRYTVTLTPAQWRTALEPFGLTYADNTVLDEIGTSEPSYEGQEPDELPYLISSQIPGPVTLTGAQWVDLTTQLASWPEYAEADDYTEGPEVPPDPAVYRAVIDRISAQLGGPAHPRPGSR